MVPRRTTEISPVVSQGDRCPWFGGAETVEVPQLQFIEGRRLPYRAAKTAPMVPPFWEDHRDSSVAACCLVVDAPVVQVVFHARCCTTGAHGSDSAELRGSAAVAVPSWLWTSLCSCSDVGLRQSSASDSVHRRSLWTFFFATVAGTRGGGDVG